MSWSISQVLANLERLITGEPFASSRRLSAPADTPIRVGCCPACHEFVRVDPRAPAARAVCPACGRTIRALDALGSPRSLGATDEL